MDGTVSQVYSRQASTPPVYNGLHIDYGQAAGNLYAGILGIAQQDALVGRYCAPPPPTIQQCALDALSAMGIAPGTFPEMEAALDGLCEDGNEEGDEITILTEPPPGNYKLTCPESLVVAQGVEIGQNTIGSNDCTNSLFLGNGATVNGNVLKTEDVWVAGTGNLITGQINHSVSLHVGPGAELTIGKSINDLQLLEIGTGGLVSIGQDMDVWIDIISTGTLNIGRNLDCNGLTGPPTTPGTITVAGNNSCSYIVAQATGGSAPWLYATLAAVLGFGFALIVRERGKKTAS